MQIFGYLEQHLRAFGFTLVRLTSGLILLAVIMAPLEKLFALRPRGIVRKGLGTDVGYYYLNNLLTNRLLALPLAALALGLQYVEPWTPHRWVADLPAWVRLAAALVVAEIGFYWGHRWMHQSGWLWRFHAIHHSPEEMDWLVNSRAHPVDMVFTRLCGYVPLYALGLAQTRGNRVDWLPLAISLVGSIWGYFIHANVRVRLGWLENIVATPGFHHWHHNREGPEHIHKNYAPTMPFVDRLFGTHFRDRAHFPDAYGIDETLESGLAGQLIEPFDPAVKTASRQL